MEILAFKHEGDATDLLLVLLQRIWHVQFLMHFLPLLMSLDWMDWNRTLAQNVRSSLMLCRRNLKIVTLFQFPWHERLRWREQKPTHSGTLWCWWYAHRTSQSGFTGDTRLFAGLGQRSALALWEALTLWNRRSSSVTVLPSLTMLLRKMDWWHSRMVRRLARHPLFSIWERRKWRSSSIGSWGTFLTWTYQWNVAPLLNSVRVCWTYLPLAAIAAGKSEMSLRSLTWPTAFARPWYKRWRRSLRTWIWPFQ